jgi:protein SCO1
MSAATDPIRDILDRLDERHPMYVGRGASAAARLRGYTLAAFERHGLPEAGLPYVIEALESGREAYLIAAGAKALRGASRVEPWMLPLVQRALAASRSRDDEFSFESLEPVSPLTAPTTLHRELSLTLEWLSERLNAEGAVEHSCCGAVVSSSRSRAPQTPSDVPAAFSADRLWNVVFQDQDTMSVTGGTLFVGKPSAVAFFYTRCQNPARCSTTVFNLGRLQRLLSERGVRGRVRLLGVTYDPAFDTPERLRDYGTLRRFEFDDDCRLLRSVAGLTTLRETFGLGVGYGPATVNHHRIELFVLDSSTRITRSFTRAQWDPEDVAEALCS